MPDGHPLSADRCGEEKMPMNTMEILTLLLVIFEALSFIDNRFSKKK